MDIYDTPDWDPEWIEDTLDPEFPEESEGPIGPSWEDDFISHNLN